MKYKKGDIVRYVGFNRNIDHPYFNKKFKIIEPSNLYTKLPNRLYAIVLFNTGYKYPVYFHSDEVILVSTIDESIICKKIKL